MATTKLLSGSELPSFSFPTINGRDVTIGRAQTDGNWQLVFVYRGFHCPVCRQYLTKLDGLKDQFTATNAEIVAISGDPEEKARRMVEEAKLTFPVGYGLSVDQMRALGLYISAPRSPEETDRPFAEPGMFAVNAAGKVQLIDISNTPFNRADLGELVETVEWIIENDYPIRGTLE